MNKNADKHNNGNINGTERYFFNDQNAQKFIYEALDKADQNIDVKIPDIHHFEALVEDAIAKTSEPVNKQKYENLWSKIYHVTRNDQIVFAVVALALIFIQLFIIFKLTNIFLYFQIGCIIIPVMTVIKNINKRVDAA